MHSSAFQGHWKKKPYVKWVFLNYIQNILNKWSLLDMNYICTEVSFMYRYFVLNITSEKSEQFLSLESGSKWYNYAFS